MSKYSAFGDYLKKQRFAVVPMTFDRIETIIGSKLPASARRYRPWWSNNPHNSVMTKVWLDAGFESEQVDIATGKLVFRRLGKPKAAAVGGEEPFHPAYGFMKGLVRIMPGSDLTQPADPEWAARLEAEYGPEKREE